MAGAFDPRLYQQQQQEQKNEQSQGLGSLIEGAQEYVHLPQIEGDVANVTAMPQEEPQPIQRHDMAQKLQQPMTPELLVPDAQPLPALQSSPQLTYQRTPPDQAMHDLESPQYAGDETLMQRIDAVVNVGRQLRGQMVRPEIAYDLARSGIPMEQVAQVLRYMGAHGDGTDVYLQNQDVMAHNIVSHSSALGMPAGAKGAGVVPQQAPGGATGLQFHTDTFQYGLGQAEQNSGVDYAIGAVGVVKNFWENIVHQAGYVSAQDPTGEGDWVPVTTNQPTGFMGIATSTLSPDLQAQLKIPTGQMQNRVTGEVINADDPRLADPLVGRDVPNTGWQDTNIDVRNGYPTHTVSDLRRSMADFGMPVDPTKTGPLDAEEVRLWRTYYEHQGGENVATQLQLQEAGFGTQLPITGFFDPTNADGTVNDTGERWNAALTDYQHYLDAVQAYVREHPESALLMRDVGVAAMIMAWSSGDDQFAKQETNKFLGGITKTTITKGTPLQPIEMGLRAAMAFANNMGSALWTIPNQAIMNQKIQSDPQWQSLIQRAYESGQLDKTSYEQLNELDGFGPFALALTATKDPAIQQQLRDLSLKTLADYGYYNPLGGPLGQSDKQLGAFVELALLAAKPNSPQTEQMVNYLEDHPLVADLANMILTWKLVPAKGGVTTRGAARVPGAWLRTAGRPGGTLNWFAREADRAWQEERLPEQARTGAVATTGTSHPHLLENEAFSPAQEIENAIREDIAGPAEERFLIPRDGKLQDAKTHLEKQDVPYTVEDVPAAPASYRTSELAGRMGERTPAQLRRQTLKQGGLTYQPNSQIIPTKGFAVGVAPERGVVLNTKNFKMADLSKFVSDNADLLADKSHFLGTWVSDGKVYLDISRVTKDELEAERLRIMHNQESYYDLGRGETRAAGKAYQEVPNGPAQPGGSAETGGPGQSGLRVRVQLPWEYRKLANAVEGKDWQIVASNGERDVQLPTYQGPTVVTRGMFRDAIGKRLDALNARIGGNLLATRMSLPARINITNDMMAASPRWRSVGRLMAVRAYNGILDHTDPATVDRVRTIVRQFVDDPIIQRKILNNIKMANAGGPKMAGTWDSAMHQLYAYLDQHYALPNKMDSETLVRSGNASGWAMPTSEGGQKELSIYDTELGHYASYAPSLEGAAPKEDLLSQRMIGSALQGAPEKVQQAWVNIDRNLRAFGISASRRANLLNFYLYRKPATFVSPPFMGKVWLRYLWTKLKEGINDGGYGRLFNQAIERNPAQARLFKVVIPRQQAGDVDWYFGEANSNDQLLIDGLERRAHSYQIQSAFRNVYGKPLTELLGEERYAQMGEELRLHADRVREQVARLEQVPEGGEAYLNAQGDLPKFRDELIRRQNALRFWQEDRVHPLNGGDVALRQELEAWLASPQGQYAKDAWSNQTGHPWDDQVSESYLNAATAQLAKLWYDRPNLRDALLAGEQDGKKLLNISRNANELYDGEGKLWFPIKNIDDKGNETALKKAVGKVDDKLAKFSYFALKDVKARTFRQLSANVFGHLQEAVKAGELTEAQALELAIYRGRDLANDLMFDLKTSQLQIEMRLRFLAPFVTKRRLFWQHVVGATLTDPRVQMALSEVSKHIEAMNADQNEFNRDKLTFTLPFGVGPFAAGSTVDFHLYNQFWLNQADELENYALLQTAAQWAHLAPQPQADYRSVFGYNPSAQAPNATLLPRINDWVIWLKGLMQIEGKYQTPGQPAMPLDQIYGDMNNLVPGTGMRPDLVAQHQAMTNAIFAQHYRSGDQISVEDAAKQAFIDLFIHSSAKLFFPGAPGITPAEKVATQSEVQAYWNAKSQQEIDALEAQNPNLTSELKLARDPEQFKQWVVASAKANIIQMQFAQDVQNFQAEHHFDLTTLVRDKRAQDELTQIKRVRDNAYNDLAAEFPVWGESHGYGTRDKNGVWRAKDDVRQMLAQRGSTQELAPGQEGLLQQAQKMYSNFIEQNNVVPVSQKDHDNLLKVLETYKSLDDAISNVQALPDSTEKDKTLKDLLTQRAHFRDDFSEILDAYWPKGQKTIMEQAREQYYKDVYIPWVNSLAPIFDQMDKRVNPFLSKKEKGLLEDKLTVTKDTFNHPYTLPQFPGTVFPAPEETNWQMKTPENQAISLGTWQGIGSKHPEWLTQWQRSLLADPKKLGEAIKGWDQATYNLYLGTLKDELGKFTGGYSFGRFFGRSSFNNPRNVWRRAVAASGHEPFIFGKYVPVTNERPGKVLPTAAAVAASNGLPEEGTVQTLFDSSGGGGDVNPGGASL